MLAVSPLGHSRPHFTRTPNPTPLIIYNYTSLLGLQAANNAMSEYTTISLKKEFVRDVEAYLEDETYGSVKEFVKHLLIREMESGDGITEAEARQLGQKLEQLGYVE